MNKTVSVLVIVGAVLVAILLGGAFVSFVVWPHLKQALASEPTGVVLVYEVDPKSKPDAGEVDMAQLVAKIDARLNSDSKVARVRELPDSRVELALYSTDEATVVRVERVLQHAGTLEFRMLADKRDNNDLVARALAEPSKSRLLDDKGRPLAWWVSINAQEKAHLASDSNIALREKKNGNDTIAEVLVASDDYNINGAYLKRADIDVDERGQPCIRITLNKHGGELFGLLTTYYSPNSPTDPTYLLGIILDGRLCSAPAIKSPIYERALITGSFTYEEVRDLVAVLNSGSLPAKIRPVKK
jgi:SecD/SecF fusion protein